MRGKVCGIDDAKGVPRMPSFGINQICNAARKTAQNGNEKNIQTDEKTNFQYFLIGYAHCPHNQ